MKLADATRAAERQRLGELASEMRELHMQFESRRVGLVGRRARHARSSSVKRARSRCFKSRCFSPVSEKWIGLGQLERLPFERKIEQIEGYLREAAETRQAPLT